MSGYQVSLYTSQVPARGHYEPDSCMKQKGLTSRLGRPPSAGFPTPAAAVSTVRTLLGASHEDLRLRVQQLSRALGSTFFYGANAEARMLPFSATSRFPEQELFVCPDLSPVAPALQAVNQAMAQVALKDARQEACASYYDAVGKLLRLLADNMYECHLFNQESFEAEFNLK